LFEVVCLLDTSADAVRALRDVWAGLGTSIVTVGAEATWHCHVHTDDPDSAVAAARQAGRPRRIEVTDLAECRGVLR